MGAKKPKSVKEPDATGGGFLGSAGSILMGLAGIAFVAYVFNYGGLQTTVDGLLHGLDGTARSHTDRVTAIFLVVLPVAATLLGGGILYILLSALGNAILSPIKEARKKKAKALAKAAKAAAQPVGAAPEPMVLVRPARLKRKEIGVEHLPARG